MRLLLACILALVPAAGARAVGLYFDFAPATATAICADPCYRVQMFLEDPTRVIEVQAVQFDVAVLSGGAVASLPVPPGANSNASGGNITLEGAEGEIAVTPWNLASTVGRSPNTGFHALIVNAAETSFDVKSLAAQFADQVGCAPASLCTLVGGALAANRIYLGRFNMTLTGTPSFRVGGITGNGPGIMNPAYGVVRFNFLGFMSCQGGICRTTDEHSQAPEPAGAILFGLALAALALRRRGRGPGIPVALALAVASLLTARPALADPPPLIQYQGILLAPNGSPRVGPVDLGLALFDAPTQGTELYRESHAGVPLVDGAFTILIGGGQDRVPSALSPAVFTGPGTRWLQISVDGEVLAPRQQMLSVPYSFESSTSSSLQGRTLEQVVGAPSPVSGYEQLSAGFLGTSADASCPAGKVVVGGGCDCVGTTAESRPVGGFNSWHCECSGAGANRAWVLCAAAGGPVCGNGVRDAGEQCDSTSASACADGRCGEGCACACGNGVLDAPEQCDGFTATGCIRNLCGADCTCACGNGALDAGEQCDGSAGTCPAGSSCRGDCACRVCGDAVLDPGEQCDGSAAGACSNGACSAGCRCTCGNGALDPGEQCDGALLGLCPASSTGCSGSCACVRCGDAACADTESATSCPQDCQRSYRTCSSDDDCDFGLYCNGRWCTDSCYQTCDLDPDFDEVCSSTLAIGFCTALCRFDSATSTYTCPGDLVCTSPLSGGTCRAP